MKKGMNNGIVLSIFLLILIVAVLIIFFYTDILKDKGMNKINLRAEECDLSISSFKTIEKGVEFILKVDPRDKEIVMIEFSFENIDHEKEVYVKNVSYIQKAEYGYSITLEELYPGEINKIFILPTFKDEDMASMEYFIEKRNNEKKNNKEEINVSKNWNEFVVKVKNLRSKD
jgi:hypothetical protein